MITENTLYGDYEHYKAAAARSFSQGKVEDSLEAMRLACILAKNYYLCYEDDELESLLQDIAAGFPATDAQDTRDPRKFIFYDTHTTDNIALTQQYLGALIAWGADFVYVTTKSLSSPKTKLIAGMLAGYGRARTYELPATKSVAERVHDLRAVIDESDAGKALIQTTADDLAGCIAFAPYTAMTRYYLDISDHSFWIGATFFDRYIEFRSYGCNICEQHRNIPREKVLVQPYYPVLASKPYRGIPELSPTSVRIVSGGRIEKIYGMEDMYFELVADLMRENPSVEFYYAGGGAFGKAGQTSYVETQLHARGVGERFHYLGFRDDLVGVLDHMDIYMGTYPLGGGLMTQLAASKSIPIVQYVSHGLSSSVNEFLVGLAPDDLDTFVFYEDKEGFLRRLRLLVDDSDERKRMGVKYHDALTTKEEFDSELAKVVFEDNASHDVRQYEVDCSDLRRNQVDVENHCYHSYERIMVKSAYVRKHEPVKYAESALGFVRLSDKRWLRAQMRARVFGNGGGVRL